MLGLGETVLAVMMMAAMMRIMIVTSYHLTRAVQTNVHILVKRLVLILLITKPVETMIPTLV
jgi:hypothetical protein